MNVRKLLDIWEHAEEPALAPESFEVRLSMEDAAKLRALADIYSHRSMEDITTDLLSQALSEIESSLPYKRGKKVTSFDEMGDPLYEDVGPTPKFLALRGKYLKSYRQSHRH